jgi:formylglycine-generating enzyme required for sulfatase activity
MTPVYGISWREAALYCNWLQGGQSSDPASLLTGAYDVSTWGNLNGGVITDAPTHLPGARFWIPTINEQVKAFHYDPNRNGPGQGGYWLNKNMRDVDGIAGPPGVGQTSARWVDPNVNNGELMIPLGAYPDQLSPWGLLDTSGGATEWSEQIAPQSGPPGGRFLYGASAGQSSTGDALWNSSSVSPSLAGIAYGFRIASTVPSPGVGVTALAFGSIFMARRKRSSMRSALPLALLVSAGWASPALAQQDYGIDFVTVGAMNNAPLTRSGFPDFPNSPSVGRGSVSYEYRIGRTEITTAQWMQFVNTFNGTTFADAPPFFHWAGPFSWGATDDPTYGGPGFRYVLPASNPNAAMTPVYGISWRESALYCNWLQGGQSSDPASLLTGAYDVSTWGPGPQGTFTDAPNHLPGARFWIPTFDEQLKAFHYDPNRNGPGQGGYWLNKNMRDTTGIAGVPGVGQTSARWVDPNVNNGELMIPLGAYSDQVSPWGLLDTSGGATEWNERVAPGLSQPSGRGLFGASAGASSTDDSIYGSSGVGPDTGGIAYGFRIASTVPSPGVGVTAVVMGGILSSRRKRRST